MTIEDFLVISMEGALDLTMLKSHHQSVVTTLDRRLELAIYARRDLEAIKLIR